jgi:predicted unusual protein kinase regulating ubiquinone biosynthesis (AarF/ABC1/UbiB family)
MTGSEHDRRRDLADRGFETLRGMHALRGALARTADFVPPELRPRRRGGFGAGSDPDPMAWKAVERILADAWGERVRTVLEEIDPAPAALSTTGQVHRAVRSADGREIAVKVQRPGIAEAVRADLQNVGALARLGSAMAPGVDVAGLAAEIRERMLEELDHELEAQAQRVFARAYRGHPFIHVPVPDTGLSHTLVLVSEWVDGPGLDAAYDRPQAERDRLGEIVFRFFLGSPYRVGRDHGDPHPGNLRLMADGRLGILDFGAGAPADTARVRAVAAVLRAGNRGDAAAAHAGLAGLGYLPDPAAVDPGELLAIARGAAGWLAEDRELIVDVPLARASMAALRDGDHAGALIGQVAFPPQDLVARRQDVGLFGVLAQLRPTANWWRIGAEWWEGSEPATELGVAEAGFWARR